MKSAMTFEMLFTDSLLEYIQYNKRRRFLVHSVEVILSFVKWNGDFHLAIIVQVWLTGLWATK